ncbi:FimV family protein [Chitinibacter fontanus]|uniref:FimV family protein n=1 Tax=Chitinibacter fontanus TaxID=1737446 RepID=A0A7D5ZFY1_9NEIS|nr:FimV family protein [Chitinibacter fontanus]QLI82906.1 FimV family protein [Chitinibacter fontanus]
MPLISQAAGLGRLNVLSGLGQPFRGEIDLVSVQPNEADSLVVSLAPPESYSNAQIAYPSSSLGLRFNIEKRSNGQYYVVVNSSQPITEPFLDLLVELNWAAGRIQREYTALIDPADYTGGASGDKARFASSDLPGTQVKGVIKGSKAKKSKSTAALAESGQSAEATAKQSSESVASTSSQSAGGDAHKVKSGETLGSIARQVQPSGVSLEQVLVGLYKANPSAFDGNMNRLKTGKILNVPAADQLKQTSKAEAVKEIQVQAGDWNAYRGKLAEGAAKAPAKSLNEQQAGGKITAKVQDQGASAVDANKDVLKLSKAADAAKKAGDSAKLQALEEEIATRQKALDEANQRVAALQKNVADMEKLAALKASAAASKASKVAEVASVAVAVASAASEAGAVAASEVASAAAVATAKPKRRIQVEAPVVEEPSFVDGLMENSLALGGGLLAVVLGGVGLWWARRRQTPGVFEDSIITGGDLKANTVLGSTGGGVISTQATENSFLTDFSRQGLGTIDTDEVDPIAEAEVYMAYGRDAQAEEILKDALNKDPARHEIRMKLLDIYAARRDAGAYEEHASALFAVTNGQGDYWREAALNGRAIDPENPLYRKEPAGLVDTSVAVAATAVAATVVEHNSQVADLDGLDEPTAPDVNQVASNELDFELDFDSEVEAVKSSVLSDSTEVDSRDLDLNLSVEQSVEQAIEQVSDSDFGLDIDLPPVTVEHDLPAVDEADSELMALDLPIDLGGELSSGLLNEVQESTLGLDLDLGSALEGHQESIISDNAPVADVADFSFDLPVLETAGEDAADTALSSFDQSLAPAVDDLKLDFDFDLGSAEHDAPALVEDLSAAVSELEADTTFGDISLDLTEAAAAGDLDFAADDPVQTKIDLAKAYIDMGDVEGAREILQEALQEGSAPQQQIAKSLLADL